MSDIEKLTRVASGIPGLDTVLGGGFFKGGLYLIQGTPGTGKTTIANQICFDYVKNGGQCAYRVAFDAAPSLAPGLARPKTFAF